MSPPATSIAEPPPRSCGCLPTWGAAARACWWSTPTRGGSKRRRPAAHDARRRDRRPHAPRRWIAGRVARRDGRSARPWRTRPAGRRALMGSVRLAAHLAWRNIRRRPAQAALILLTLTTATGMFGVGMALYGSADGPWDRVWKATDGFHVSASYYRQGDLARTGTDLTEVRHRFAELAAAPGVRAVGGPWLQLQGRLDLAHGGYEDLTAEVRGPGRSPVD